MDFVIRHSYLIPLLPLLGAAVAGFFGARYLKGNSHWPIWIGVGSSAVLSFTLLFGMLGRWHPQHEGGGHGSEARAAEPLIKLLESWPRNRRLLFCDETRDGRPIAEALGAERAKMPEPWAILIGPEGGFAPEELARIRALPGIVPVSLGARLLRADTAALAALAVWQAVM